MGFFFAFVPFAWLPFNLVPFKAGLGVAGLLSEPTLSDDFPGLEAVPFGVLGFKIIPFRPLTFGVLPFDMVLFGVAFSFVSVKGEALVDFMQFADDLQVDPGLPFNFTFFPSGSALPFVSSLRFTVFLVGDWQ